MGRLGEFNLVTDFRKSYKEQKTIKVQAFFLTSYTSKRIIQFAEKYQASVTDCLTAIYGLLLHKYTGQLSVVTGCGMVPVAMTFEPGTTFTELLNKCKNYSSARTSVEPSANLSLSFVVMRENVIEMAWHYEADLFRKETINRMGQHFLQLAEAALKFPEQDVSELSMISDEEERTLFGFNCRKSQPETTATIHGLFEAQVNFRPDDPAVVFGGKALTYRELDSWANRWAGVLRDRFGVRPETSVGILMQNRLEYLIAVLSVLKAGGAFVPIDTDLPLSRISMCLEEASVSLVLTASSYNDKVKSLLVAHPLLKSCVFLDTQEVVGKEVAWIDLDTYSINRVQSEVTARNMAFHIFILYIELL